jgi:serine/threonine-protein kinase
MELVEGPTLADRIAQGPVPLDEALPIAKQIAEALEAAHDHGIVHRDLKPANIKLRPDGTVKVLDFGLAKAMETGPAGPSIAASMSPTITSPALTGRNVILGTAAYMSPEQARGKPVDKRTDIWAFGCVVYEMLSGRRAFDGDDVTVTLARVVEREPDWAAVSGQPSSVRALLRRCLEKDPRRRMRDIGDARLALEGVFDIVVPADGPGSHDAESADAQVRRSRRVRSWLLGASAGIVVTAAAAWLVTRESPPQPEYVRLAAEPQAPLLVSTFHRDIAISPDGSRVAMTTRDDTWRIEIISLDSREPITLVSEGQPFGPFFSYDGEWVGFYDQKSSELRRVRANGDGRVETICPIGTGQVRGATWGRDGTIVYGSTHGGLWLVTPRLGEPGRFNEPEPLTVTDGTDYHHWPSLLPGDDAVLFTVTTPGSTTMQLAVASLDTGTVTPLGMAGSAPRYVPTGHLLYAVHGALRAVSFDPALQIPTRASSAVEANVLLKSSGAASFDVSESGTLMFLPPVASQPRTLGLV